MHVQPRAPRPSRPLGCPSSPSPCCSSCAIAWYVLHALYATWRSLVWNLGHSERMRPRGEGLAGQLGCLSAHLPASAAAQPPGELPCPRNGMKMYRHCMQCIAKQCRRARVPEEWCSAGGHEEEQPRPGRAAEDVLVHHAQVHRQHCQGERGCAHLQWHSATQCWFAAFGAFWSLM